MTKAPRGVPSQLGMVRWVVLTVAAQAVGASPVSRINSSTTLRIVVSPRRWWCNGSDRTSANGGWHLATQHGAFEPGARLDRCRTTFRRGGSPTPPGLQVASMQVCQRRPGIRTPRGAARKPVDAIAAKWHDRPCSRNAASRRAKRHGYVRHGGRRCRSAHT